LRIKTPPEVVQAPEVIPVQINWNSEEGFRFAAVRIHSAGYIFLCSRDWWKTNAVHYKSKIKVLCPKCEYVSEPTLYALRTGRKLVCWCNNLASWAGEQGRQRYLHIIASRRLNVDVSQLTTEWWEANIKDSNSRPNVRCKVCHHICTSTINSVVNSRKDFGCFCNNSVPWTGEVGRLRFIQVATDRKLTIDLTKITEKWWKRHITGSNSNILAHCLECGHLTSSTIATIMVGKNPGCWCNGAVPWKIKHGWERMLRIIDELGLDGSIMTWLWWEQHITGCYSKLLIKCKECLMITDTTSIDALYNGSGIRCLCRWKTQKKLHDWLQTVGNVDIEAGTCINPETGYRLPVDFFVTTSDLQFGVELDGSQHFGWNHFAREFSALAAEHDLFKEEWMLNQGRSVIRLYQPDVLHDTARWQEFIQDSIDKIRKTTEAKVYTPDIPQYRSGLYALLRGAQTRLGSQPPQEPLPLAMHSCLTIPTASGQA
jgi:hypothetical protein